MKTILSTLISCFVLGLCAEAQRPITIIEGNITFKHGIIPGIFLTIPEVSFKKVQDSWIKLQEKGTKSKVQNDNNELSIFGALIKDVAAAPINVYSYVKDNDTVILLATSFELRKNVYVSMESDPDEFMKAKEFLLSFAKDHYLELVKEQLDNEEKKLSKLESLLKSLENDKVKIEKMVQTNTTKIGSTNDELVILRTNLLSLNDELLAQTNQLNALEEGPSRDEKEKYVSDLEKRIKKTNKNIESGEKKIVNMQADIEKGQKDGLPGNIKEQEQIRQAIDQQKEVVGIYRAKYNTINDYR